MRILFVTDKYWPKPLANAVCAQRVAEALVSDGDSVDMLIHDVPGVDSPDEINGVRVFSIDPGLKYKLFYFARDNPSSTLAPTVRLLGSLISKAKKLLLVYYWPMDAIGLNYRVASRIQELDDKYNYDCIVTLYGPISAAIGGYIYKKRNATKKWIVYAVDSFQNARQTWLPNSLRWAHFWLPRLISECDGFIMMRSRYQWYQEKQLTSRFADKLFVSDIPLLAVNSHGSRNAAITKEENCVIWLYAGTVAPPHYVMDDLFRFFERICKSGGHHELHVYSSGLEYESLRKSIRAIDNVYLHDYVTHDELDVLFDTADVLVSVKYSDQISAKVFEYISKKKPVIHVSGNDNDPDINYIKNYPLGIVVSASEDTDYAASRILDWELEVLSAESATMNLEYFNMNRPEYTANLLEEIICSDV